MSGMDIVWYVFVPIVLILLLILIVVGTVE